MQKGLYHIWTDTSIFKPDHPMKTPPTSNPSRQLQGHDLRVKPISPQASQRQLEIHAVPLTRDECHISGLKPNA